MKRIITILVLLSSVSAFAQVPSGFTTVGNGLSRKISGSDTTWYFNNAPGGFYVKSNASNKANFAPFVSGGYTLQNVTNLGATSTNAISLTTSTAGSSTQNALSLLNTSVTAGSNVSPSLKLFGNFGSATSGWQLYTVPGPANVSTMNFQYYNGSTYVTRLSLNQSGSFGLINTSGFTASINPGFLTSSRTFSLPDAAGTFALTSDLTSKVPYTGATSYLDLGNNYLKTHDITVAATATPTINTQILNTGITVFNTTNEILSTRAVDGEIAYTNVTSGGATSLTFEHPTGLNAIVIPDKSGTILLSDAIAYGSSPLTTITNYATPPITFDNMFVYQNMHWSRVGDQVTVDVKIVQNQTTWSSGDDFYFYFELPVDGNVSDLIGSMVVSSQDDGVFNPITNLLIEPNVGASPARVDISGAYAAAGAANISYMLHIVYTVS